MTDVTDIPKKTERLPWRLIGEHIVAIEPTRGEVSELNEAASWLWERIDGKLPLTSLASALASEFEVSGEQALEDTACLMAELHEKGLITWETPGAHTN